MGIIKKIIFYSTIPMGLAILIYNLFGRGEFANIASIIALFVGIGIASALSGDEE